MAQSKEIYTVGFSSTLGLFRKSEFIRSTIATFSILGLLFTVSVIPDPAVASEPPLVEESKFAKLPSQTLTVSSLVEMPELSRDGYSATSLEELTAMRAAEAARIEQERVAAESATTIQSFSAVPPNTSYSGDAIIAYAEQFVGVVPYGYGNNPADSFSCDGLVQYVFGQFGITLGRGVTAQAEQGIQISADQAQAGDLVVWPGEHIGIYDGNGGVIHSPDFGRMVTHANNLWGSYYFVRIA